MESRVPPEDRHYPFFACFYFEAFLSKENLPSSGPKLSYKARHVSMSLAIAFCIPGKEDPVCFVPEEDERDDDEDEEEDEKV